MKNKTLLASIAIILVAAAIGYVIYQHVPKPALTTDTPVATTTDNMPQGKLNIDLVCQGSLSYMSFPDGASADKFVAECKEGKHPEVIEHYKSQMNFGAGAQI